jgi:hypothetical protein
MRRFLPQMICAFTFVASFVTRGQTAVSENPLDSWQLVASPLIGLRGIAYQDGRFAAVGRSTNAVVSTNGTEWSMVTNGLTPHSRACSRSQPVAGNLLLWEAPAESS